MPTFLTQLLVPLTERLIALEQAVVGGGLPMPPLEVLEVAAVETPAVTPTMEQGSWVDMIAKFQKLRAPEFDGEKGPLAADKWKEDITNVLELMDVESVQMQRLAAFTLKGDASKWYRSHFTKEERLTATWEEFLYRFDAQYISAAALATKEAELISLEQGDMTVTAYESKFESLCHFTGNMFQTEERKARMFEKGLRPQLRRYLVSHRHHTVRDVADAAMAQEQEGQKAKEATTKAAAQSDGKSKGKRPFTAMA